ncbi:MAG: NAD(P)-binding protein [Alphaproteobacteria bacterium]|nr:NAD(P)-binding protein [Alphaproteobacteria bacterium]
MSDQNEVDVVVVGAGFSGLYLLHLLRKNGFSTRVFERGDDVGGTWYWNRYPGARCDVESMQYSYSFDEDLQQEWHWPEKYSSQPEILAYIQHVAERFDLRKDITFGASVTAARFDETANRWTIETDSGESVSAQFFIMATGCISTANMPDIPGVDGFTGNIYHTGNWPHEKVDFTGQKVGVVGTGSSAIQAIPVIAAEADHLTVFQRTPHWTVPARNVPMTDEYEAGWKDSYAEKRANMRGSMSGSLRAVAPIDVSALDVTEGEREEAYRERWAAGGMTLLRSYNDLLTSDAANETAASWVRRRIAATVEDPDTAELLAPKTYPLGTKRLCLDTDYYETYNRDNVDLVDIASAPIDRITATGLETGGRDFTFDSIVFATGFDAMTGTLVRVDIQGRGALTLKDKWHAGPRTYLGLMTEAFPNLFTITGPGSPSVKSNMLTSIEQHAEFVTDTLTHLREHNIATIEPEQQAEDGWTDHVQEVANMTLFPKANSWYMGANIPGKPRLFMPYIGGVGAYREKCDAVAAAGYEGFRLECEENAAAAE